MTLRQPVGFGIGDGRSKRCSDVCAGLSTGSRTPPSGKGPGNRGPDGEYTGPVFIVRELNKEKGEYDAFITTGGIQEVKPAQGGRAPPHGHQKPAAVRGDAEDAEYFGMLVTPETVRALDHPSAAAVNVSLSTLLVAASSRMPWLLVLRRADYPQLFEHQHQPAAAVPSAPPAVVPGMQIPQRRRYYAADGGRQRRGLYPAPYGQRAAAADDYDDYEPGRTFPPAFERQLLSTMCYNFVRDYTSAGDLPRLPIALAEPEDRDRDERGPVIIDADAYAAAAFRDAPPAAPATSPPDGQQQQQPPSSPVQMAVPKRVPS